MSMMHTEADFDRLSWHDCHIWGVDFRIGQPDENDWTSDLVLDIDFIVAWMCGVSGGAQFRVAPATLTFHGVTDPRIGIDWGQSGFQVALYGCRSTESSANGSATRKCISIGRTTVGGFC